MDRNKNGMRKGLNRRLTLIFMMDYDVSVIGTITDKGRSALPGDGSDGPSSDNPRPPD
jgi:hypothetical protein